MFESKYIFELLKGQLSEDGYKHFLKTISSYIKKFNWPKTIITSNIKNSSYFWSTDDIMELSHQYFEWIIIKGKLEYLNKIPDNYIAYYFLQMLISFVNDRIKQEQNISGLSFEKCKELVLSISKEFLISKNIGKIIYVFNKVFSEINIKPDSEIQNVLISLPKIPLTEKTKHYKPLVKLAIEDILNALESPIELNRLFKNVYDLFDQKSFKFTESYNDTKTNEYFELNDQKQIDAISNLLSGITKEDALLIRDYLFQSVHKTSMSDLALKFKLPKSSIHIKINSFKKRILNFYAPENEDDGILFLKNLASALDKFTN